MTDAEPLQGGANDAELISRVRGGDVDAYGELFSRHIDAATRLARMLTGPADADDLVSEAFTKVLHVLLGGGGPDIAFRAYLLTAVRRLHVDRIRSTRRATPTDDLEPYDPGVPFHDTVVAGFEGGAAARAFASLPERWQMVLWHLEVEGQKPADIAPLLGMSANSVSALAYRAREGLRQAFLQMHTADLVGENCRWTHDKLGAYVRNGLSRRDQDKVERHLDECRRCTAIYLELAEVNSSLAALIGPLVLGGAAAAYLSGTTAGAGLLAGLGALVGRARDAIVANSQTAIAVGAAAGVAGAATVGVLIVQHQPKEGTLALSHPEVSQQSSASPHQPSRTHASTGQPSPSGTSNGPTGPASRQLGPAQPLQSTIGATTRGPAGTGPGPGTVTAPSSQPTQSGPAPQGPQQPTTGGGQPGPSTPPTSKPPAPKPPAPKPPSKPPSTPPAPPSPPSSPPVTTADVSLSAHVTSMPRAASAVTADVEGVPEGSSARLVIEANGLAKLAATPPGWSCTPDDDRRLTCTVSSGTVVLTIVHPLQGLHLKMHVGPAAGYRDPDPSNNSYACDSRHGACD
ncbi:MAG TPA: sigma-70 family RNA polymerase sigma factor [Marmoricola sp.]